MATVQAITGLDKDGAMAVLLSSDNNVEVRSFSSLSLHEASKSPISMREYAEWHWLGQIGDCFVCGITPNFESSYCP